MDIANAFLIKLQKQSSCIRKPQPFGAHFSLKILQKEICFHQSKDGGQIEPVPQSVTDLPLGADLVENSTITNNKLERIHALHGNMRMAKELWIVMRGKLVNKAGAGDRTCYIWIRIACGRD